MSIGEGLFSRSPREGHNFPLIFRISTKLSRAEHSCSAMPPVMMMRMEGKAEPLWAAPLRVPPLLPETSCRNGSSPRSRLQSHSFPLRGEGRRQAAEPGLDANPAWPRSCPQLTLGAITGSPSPDCSPPMLAPTQGCRSTRQPPEMSVSWQRAQPGVPKPGSSSRGYLRDAAVVCVQPSPAGTARPRAGAVCSRPWAPGYGFGLAASPGPSTRWLHFLLGLHFHRADNSRDPEIAGDAQLHLTRPNPPESRRSGGQVAYKIRANPFPLHPRGAAWVETEAQPGPALPVGAGGGGQPAA